MNKLVAVIPQILKYLLIGAVCGLALNTLIMKSPLPEIFPYYVETTEKNIYSVDIMYGIFLYCMVSPLLEEILFRVFLYNFLYSKLGFYAASFLSSLVFAIFHMNMVQGVYGFIMALLICFLYNRDHNIYVPVSIHIGANTAVWLFANLIFGI
ncbi:MAG: CPBP family intramembrane metalloprotease [Lachnospiraceae bacterium]|nr:CPBP family intramembrane metalloprotease [Lachnospiraceae bacterium]